MVLKLTYSAYAMILGIIGGLLILLSVINLQSSSTSISKIELPSFIQKLISDTVHNDVDTPKTIGDISSSTGITDTSLWIQKNNLDYTCQYYYEHQLTVPRYCYVNR